MILVYSELYFLCLYIYMGFARKYGCGDLWLLRNNNIFFFLIKKYKEI